jgi:PKD repeat protein
MPALGIDLTSTVGSVTPSPVLVGGQIDINFGVTRFGSSNGGQHYPVGLYVSSDTVLDGGDVLLTPYELVGTFSPGCDGCSIGTTVKRTLPANLTAGTWYIISKVDPDNLVAETNESNNTAFLAFTVETCPQPFSLTSPANGANLPAATTSVDLAWSPSSGAHEYVVYFGTTNPPPVIASGVVTSPKTVSVSLGKTYYWYVEGGNDGCTPRISTPSVATFTVKPYPTASVSGSQSICAGGSAAIQAALTGTPPWSLSWSDGVPQSGISTSPATRNVSPSSTTVYSVSTVTDAYGSASGTGSATITVNASPVAVAAGSATVCTGGSASLSGSGGTSCSWSPATGLSNAGSCSPTAAPGTTTTYTLTVIGSNGCTSTNRPTATVTVLKTPGRPTINAPTAAAPGQTGLIASVANTPGNSYAWTIGNGTITAGNGTSAIIFTAGSAGTLTLSVVEKASGGGVECDSPTASASVSVSSSAVCTLSCSAAAPSSAQVGTAVVLTASSTISSCTGSPTYAWTFGDGGTSSQQNPSHTWTAPGTYTWTVTVNLAGSSAPPPACTKSGSITVTSVSCGSLSPPRLTEPAAGAAVQASSVAFSWSPVPGAARYDLYLDTKAPPIALAVSGLTITAYTVSNLAPGSSYSWQVVARGAGSCAPVPSSGSEVRSFSTAAACDQPGAFGLQAPADTTTIGTTSVALSWQPAAGASGYDVYFGASSPPPLIAGDLQGTSTSVIGLVSGSTYYWSVVAHARCDLSKTTGSSQRSFRVAGGCSAPGAFGTSSPPGGASGLPASLTLSWQVSASAASYDVYLGPAATPPPLYQSGVAGSQTFLPVSGLTSGTTYSWRVLARASCGDPAPTASTPLATFAVSCRPPGAPSFVFSPPGNVGLGQTYSVAWNDAPGLDAGGGYVVERSLSPSFAPLVDSQSTAQTSATFVATVTGTLYHRVRALPSCPEAAGPPSEALTVTIVDEKPNVVFTVPPQAVITALGERLEDKAASFTLENITKSPIQVLVGPAFGATLPFFTVRDPAGGSLQPVTLNPREPKTLEVRFGGPPTDKTGSYQGILFAASTGPGLSITPYAFVNLKVGGADSPAPQFVWNGTPGAEYAFFPGFPSSSDDTARPLIEVGIRNNGSVPMELGAEVAPEVWLEPQPGWNAPIPAGETRPVLLKARRGNAPPGSALPRYTYFTVRTKSGQTARLLVQDNDAASLAPGRSVALDHGVRSYIVPSVVRATSVLGNTFVSRLALSNSGTMETAADLFFTPSGKDGFDPGAVKKATVLVPPNDIVHLTDPLVQLYGLAPEVSGSLEVRCAPEKIGSLTVTSSVDAPARAGGTFGFQIPTVLRGEGARLGSPHLLVGVAGTSASRTNLILTETTGLAASVRVTLYDKEGNRFGSSDLTVPRYGQVQINGVVSALGGAVGLTGARVEVEVTSGGGAVVGVITVIDNTNDDASVFVSHPVTPAQPGGLRPYALVPRRYVIPSVVNGFPTFRGSDKPYTFQSLLGLSSGGTSETVFRLEYHDQNGQVIAQTVTVPGRKTFEYPNVLEQLFGVGPGQQSHGPIFVTVEGNGYMHCKVYSILDKGTLGDSFPVIPVPFGALSGGSDQKPIGVDGLEQSTDLGRGTRSNLILTEVLGFPVTVTVRLYEAGNRSSPIAEKKDLTLAPFQKHQLNTVFDGLGLGVPSGNGARMKDRTNVLCVVVATSGAGKVSGVVTTIDNKTGDTRNSLLTPDGGVPATEATIGF